MKDLGKKIDVLTKDILLDLIQLRRHLHAHPELSGQEYQTAALVAGELRKSGWEVKEAVGKTGVVAEMGNKSGSVVGLRVDMDALPIEERTGLEYSSGSSSVFPASKRPSIAPSGSANSKSIFILGCCGVPGLSLIHI